MSSGRFCYLCGSVTEDLFEGLCSLCFNKESELVTLPSKIQTSICSRCGDPYSDFKEHFIDEIVNNEVSKSLKHNFENPNIKIRVLEKNQKGRTLNAEVEVTLKSMVNDQEYSRTINTVVEIREILCERCSKKAGGYYEAIVQVRTESLDPVLKEINEVLSRLLEKDKNAFITELSEEKGGINIKLGSSKAASALGSYFKSQHNAQIKESVSLVGRKEGKNVYRKTILIRL